MALEYTRRQQELLKKILSHITDADRKLAEADIEVFMRQFYEGVPLSDLEELDPRHAYLYALESWKFIQDTKAGKPKIQIYTPTKKKQGWDDPRLVVEILNDDKPFLVDSILAEMNRLGFTIFSYIHPIFTFGRDENGTLLSVKERGLKPRSSMVESFMRLEVSSLPEDLSAKDLEKALLRVLDAVRLTVEDWHGLEAKAIETINTLSEIPGNFSIDEIAEVIAFLEWLGDANFVFMGYVEYDFRDGKKGEEALKEVAGSALGIFRLKDEDFRPRGLEAIPVEVRHYARQAELIEITKSNRKSLVHRPVHMDYLAIKRYDKDGTVIGERRFLGLFTSTVYYQSTDRIPIIRRKIDHVVERSGFNPKGHDGKALKSILEFYPRDELFQISEDDLFEISMGILALEGRPNVKVFTRKDRFERFVSCMIFVPKERFSTEMRYKLQDVLSEAYNATVSAHYTQVTESPLARLHLILKTQPGQVPEPDMEAVQEKLAQIVNLWADGLRDLLHQHHGEAHGEAVYHNYRGAFPTAYTGRYAPKNALYDIEKIEEAIESGALALDLFERPQDPESIFHIKIYNPARQVALSDILPMLENMGLRVVDEHPSHVVPLDYPEGIWIRDFRLTAAQGVKPEIETRKADFEHALSRIWQQQIDSDGFNQLVLFGGLNWREVRLLRAYAKYFKQGGFPYSQDSIEETLAAHPSLARRIVDLFATRFDPDFKGDREKGEATIKAEIFSSLALVSNVDEDRIIRHYVDVIFATLRTNYYQKSAANDCKEYISFKLRSSEVPALPKPHPFAEIFVFSRRVEGIHLRGARVARGGLRWSDRREDFRTEILGLMKAQMVKNTVIVPEGSKGGFVVKHSLRHASREEFMKEGIACYQTFLRGILDITDNVVKGKVVPPKQVVRHDDDDPYLVVAADKGTATFSDIANGISEEYGFWLGDAFASGGSAGYDHKKMGITARGAWVSVQRHFREMGHDVQKEDFSVIGIGDMAGDVFGNGMLLSEHICLVGAFNHMHIFLDPSPDAAKSYAERKRLFELPRSSWADYDSKLISRGGGIFERSAKTIKLSAQVKKLLDVEADELPPEELIQAMLRAPIDLLWNGGIGTYVKATSESNSEVGDRANDGLRVNGRELRCKVMGEGGNLGFTQRGRIEYAMYGGRINTDAIDNSAGVDCSDHEVNIKIALGAAEKKGTLDRKKRDALLVKMTDEVAALCLRDNTLQTQALTVAEQQGLSLLEAQARLMYKLEKDGLLDRALEFLPDAEALATRQSNRQGLTRPELSVLLGYSKLVLSRDLLESALPDDPYFEQDLLRYFPEPMQKDFREEITSHQLRREIIATAITNSIINRTGATFFNRVAEDTGMQPCDIARAYAVVRDCFDLRDLWSQIEALNGAIDVETQVKMFTRINAFVYQVTLWLLRNLPQPIDVAATCQRFRPKVAAMAEDLASLLASASRNAFDRIKDALVQEKVPTALAGSVASLEALSSAFDIISVADKSGFPVEMVAKIYYTLGMRLHLGWLRESATAIEADGHWPRLAVNALTNDLFDQQCRLTAEVLKIAPKKAKCQDAVDHWYMERSGELARYDAFVEDLKTAEPLDFSTLIVALRKIEAICVV